MDFLQASAVCRLCLEITSGSDIQALEGFIMYMLKLIAPTLNLEISSEPKICKKCAEKVKTSHDFKTACLENNEILQPEFLNTKTQKKDNSCKCCLCDNKSNLKKCNSKETILLNAMLDKCLPELDMKSTSQICPKCLKSLVNLFAFFNCCANTEEKIKKHLQMKGVNRKGQVSLLDIFHVHYIVKLEEDEEEEEEKEPQDHVTTNPTEGTNEEDVEDYVTVDAEAQKTGIEMESNSNGNVDSEDTISLPEISQGQATDHEEGMSEGDCEDYEEMDIKMDISETALQTGGHSNRHDEYEETFQNGNGKQEATQSKHKASIEEAVTPQDSLPAIHKCALCQFESQYKKSLTRHMKQVHKDSEHNVRTSMDFGKVVDEHTVLVESEPQFQNKRNVPKNERPSPPVLKCPDCDYETAEKTDFCEHLMGHEFPPKNILPKVYSCSMCDYQSIKKTRLRNHELMHKDPSEVTMFCCPLCNYQTKRKYDLPVHMNRRHKVSKATARNEVRDIVNATKSKMSEEESTQKEPMFSCRSCSYKTKRKYDLPKHLIRIHKMDKVAAKNEIKTAPNSNKVEV